MKYALRFSALAYLGALVLVPLAMILYRTFENGFAAFWESVTTPAAISVTSIVSQNAWTAAGVVIDAQTSPMPGSNVLYATTATGATRIAAR